MAFPVSVLSCTLFVSGIKGMCLDCAVFFEDFILGLHVTSETFPYLGIRHVGVPSRALLKCLYMPSLEECNGVC